MQRRHFEFIAATLAAMREKATRQTDLSVVTVDETTSAFADALERTNVNFDRDRFLAACGTEGAR
jgi:hypothetical protein